MADASVTTSSNRTVDFFPEPGTISGYTSVPSVLDGELKANGTYVSSYADDEDLHPYLALASLDPSRCDVECFVYPYGIVGLRDSSGQCKIARFD